MRLLKITLSVSYCLIVSYLVFFARRRRHLTERYLNIIPIKGTITEFHKLNFNISKEVYNFYVNLLGNIFLFLPIPIIIVSVFKIKSPGRIIAIAFLLSLMIEAAQYIFKIGVADVDDILLNTSGAILGVLFINLVNIKNIYYPVVKYLHTINLGS